MDWNCYSRMQQLFAAHPEYLASAAVQETLRYAESDPAYSMCQTYGITDEASLLDFINPPEPEPPRGLPIGLPKEPPIEPGKIDPKLIIIGVIALILLLRR